MLRPRNQRPIRSVAIALWGEPGETRRGPPKLLLRQTPREVGTSGWDGTWSQFPTGGTKGLCLRVWLGRAEGSSLLESAGPQKTEPPKRAKGTVVTSWAKPSTCHHSCWKELCLLSHPRIDHVASIRFRGFVKPFSDSLKWVLRKITVSLTYVL